MKLYLALALSGLLACGASKTSTLPQKVVSVSTIAESDIDVREVAADSFVLTDRAFYDSNVLVVRMPDGTVVFCSSSFETVGTSHMIAWARRALQPTKMIAINTHFHFDGSGGNEAYRNAGVTTYSTNLTKALLLERGPGMQKRTSAELGGLKGQRVGAMTLMPADNTFDEQTGLTLTFGAEQVRIVYPGPGHSVDNLIVHFPARKLLFGGCMIRAQRSIGYTGDANLEHWSHAVETAQALAPQIVVPGHGQVGGAELFAVTLDAISDTKKK